MSVVIADLAKRSFKSWNGSQLIFLEMAPSLSFKWLFTNFYVQMEACAY